MNVSASGAKFLFEIPILGGIPITESQVILMILTILICSLFIWLGTGLKKNNISKKQACSEVIVKTFTSWTTNNMHENSTKYTPFIAALFVLSALCGLVSMLGSFSPTSDLSTTLGWALLIFILITYHKVKANGFVGYLKGFTQPIFVMTPMNIIGEISTPVSMGLRLFGNAASGAVIMSLLYGALAIFSQWVLQALPETIAQIPILQAGLPAVFSLYFDLFSSLLQAFIFCMLSMAYIKQATIKD